MSAVPQVLLESSDVHDLVEAVRNLTTTIKLGEQRHQNALNQLAKADPITQMIELLKGVRKDLQALRADLVHPTPPSGEDH
ncbi:MAG TPA: hypothetical protein VGG74_11840 [Kofleriaceae bacterium]|jgi:hypothetical protein